MYEIIVRNTNFVLVLSQNHRNKKTVAVAQKTTDLNTYSDEVCKFCNKFCLVAYRSPNHLSVQQFVL